MLHKYIQKLILYCVCLFILTLCLNNSVLNASMYPAVSVQAGSLGIGVNITQPINTYFNLRLNANSFYYNYTNKINEVKYNAKLNWLSFGLLADYHPFNNGFYLTGGAYYNNNNLKLTANTSDTNKIEIGGHIIDIKNLGKGGITAKLSFNKVNPYLGFGYAATNMNSKGFTFSGELGVLFTGSPKLTYNIECKTYLDESMCQYITTAADNEEKDIYNKIKKFKAYPVAYVGIAYKF